MVPSFWLFSLLKNGWLVFFPELVAPVAWFLGSGAIFGLSLGSLGKSRFIPSGLGQHEETADQRVQKACQKQPSHCIFCLVDEGSPCWLAFKGNEKEHRCKILLFFWGPLLAIRCPRF